MCFVVCMERLFYLQSFHALLLLDVLKLRGEDRSYTKALEFF